MLFTYRAVTSTLTSRFLVLHSYSFKTFYMLFAGVASLRDGHALLVDLLLVFELEYRICLYLSSLFRRYCVCQNIYFLAVKTTSTGELNLYWLGDS